MRTYSWCALGLLTLSLPLALPAAQAAHGGTTPSALYPTLYAHVANSGSTCCTQWMNTMATDKDANLPASNLIAEPCATATVPGQVPTAGGTVVGGFGWTIPMDAALAAPLDLVAGGTVTMTAYVGGKTMPIASAQGQNVAVPANAGQVNVHAQLLLVPKTGDAIVVADGAAKTGIMFNSEFKKLEWGAATALTRLDPAAGNLVWHIWGDGACGIVSLAENPTDGLSSVTLPVKAPAFGLAAASANAQAAPGATANFALQLANPGPAATFTLSTTGLPAGYVATFVPASGTAASNATTAAALSVAVPASASAGHIVFAVTAKGPGGNATLPLSIQVTGAGTQGPGGGSGPGGDGTPSGTDDGRLRPGGDAGTTQGQDYSDLEAPGIDLAINVLVVALAIVAARRRLP